MVFLHIDKMNVAKDVNPALKLNNAIQYNNKNKIFLLIHMEGCGPCMATLPEWKKIEHVLNKFANRNDIVIADIERQALQHVKNIQNPPNSFPTIRYITNKGKFVETYEDSNITNKDRTIDSFVDWISSKTNNENNITKSGKPKNNNKTLKKSNKRGGRKWSLKYKRSINCRRPRGFSQKQYCKYSRKTK